MIETLYQYQKQEEKIIERIIDDEHIHLNHMVLPKGESLPVHSTNSNVYMIINKGILSISLNDSDIKTYPEGSILNIPYQTKMDVKNQNQQVLELFVIKAPHTQKNV